MVINGVPSWKCQPLVRGGLYCIKGLCTFEVSQWHLWGYGAQRWQADPAASPCSNVCTSLGHGKRGLHVLDGARWHPQRYQWNWRAALCVASDQLQPALAFAVTLLLRAGCWLPLENNVTYFGFETPVNLLLSFALCWDMWGFPVWKAFLQCWLCLYCHRSFW